MTTTRRRQAGVAVPIVVALTLLLAACGGSDTQVAQEAAGAAQATDASAQLAEAKANNESTAALVKAVADYLDTQSIAPAEDTASNDVARRALDDAISNSEKVRSGTQAKVNTQVSGPGVTREETRSATEKTEGRKDADAEAKSDAAKAIPEVSAKDERRYEQTGGATDVGVTKTAIKLGSINMHGMALGNVLTAPQVRGNLATATAVNDRGGVLGRRLSIIDCDDGPGEVSRAKACIKKLVGQDKIFSLITGVDWATASIHDDLKRYKLPYVGAWAYSQTEWQDPYMFPTHTSMIHEAMAGAHWVRNVIKPKTYGLICLTSPEMQLACNQVQTILDAAGAEMVKKVDVSISETSMSSQILAMRAKNPEHIIHYVINPATMAKWMVESAQQNYYPPKGVSGNHLAAEILGSLFGKHPVDRYWTNTTYKLWGPEFMAVMNKYARGNKGANHHIVQAGYVGVNLFAQAARAVGPNLTREALRAELANGSVWKTDASLDQKFAYTPAERGGDFGKQTWDPDLAQGREYIYKYTSTNTTSDPNGSPSGFKPDPDQFVITTRG